MEDRVRRLYSGDNLDVLRAYIPDASVDLIYLDPPFNSNRDYNVIFREQGASRAHDAQIRAFTDTWHWGPDAEETYRELVHGNHVPQRVSDLIVAMRSFIGENDLMAYLVMMTVRLIELHRVLKPTGSIYLHCDPTASHYLKVVMDTIWGVRNFRTEIIWKRSSAHSDAKQGRKQHGRIHDTMLFYTSGTKWIWNQEYIEYEDSYVSESYRYIEEGTGRRYTLSDLTAAKGGGDTLYEWNGVTPYRGRAWAYSRENMIRFEHEGRLQYSRSGMPRYKRYLDEMPGVPIQDVWDDIPPIGAGAAERLGYPTQKPEALLERIIRASSNEGDVVLDPFCGCGTAVAVAERLGRQWIGIDISFLAFATIKMRMLQHFPDLEGRIAMPISPADVGSARGLALQDRYEFQNWALSMVSARPVAETKPGKSKKGADRGIDGILQVIGKDLKSPYTCIVQVKSGGVKAGDVRDLVGTVEQERAVAGLLLTLEEPTRPMLAAATMAGTFHSPIMHRQYPKIQILSVADLFQGIRPDLPYTFSPFHIAQQQNRTNQPTLFDQSATGTD